MLSQMAKFGGGAIVSALGGESPDVQLVDHRLLPRPVPPARVLPRIAARIDHLAWPVDVLRLEARRRIGHELLAVDAVLIQRPSGGVAIDQLEPSAAHGLQLFAPGRDDQFHLGSGRRPQAKAHAAVGQDFGAEGHGMAADARRQGRFLRGHQRSRNSAAHSRPPRPKASARAKTTPARRMRKVWRTMSPPMFTWSSAISTTKARIA